MIDLRKLRDSPAYREGAIRKGADALSIDQLLAADESRRSLRGELERNSSRRKPTRLRRRLGGRPPKSARIALPRRER